MLRSSGETTRRRKPEGSGQQKSEERDDDVEWDEIAVGDTHLQGKCKKCLQLVAHGAYVDGKRVTEAVSREGLMPLLPKQADKKKTFEQTITHRKKVAERKHAKTAAHSEYVANREKYDAAPSAAPAPLPESAVQHADDAMGQNDAPGCDDGAKGCRICKRGAGKCHKRGAVGHLDAVRMTRPSAARDGATTTSGTSPSHRDELFVWKDSWYCDVRHCELRWLGQAGDSRRTGLRTLEDARRELAAIDAAIHDDRVTEELLEGYRPDLADSMKLSFPSSTRSVALAHRRVLLLKDERSALIAYAVMSGAMQEVRRVIEKRSKRLLALCRTLHSELP